MTSMTHDLDAPTVSWARTTQAPSQLDLWPCDEEADAVWEARRGRRQTVRRAGWTILTTIVVCAAGLAGSSVARSEMLAWGTMGSMSAPRHAPAVAGRMLVVAASGPVEEPESAPAAVAPAPSPVPPPALPALLPTARIDRVAVRAPARITRRARDIDDPYADIPTTQKRRAVEADDPY
jgi:hypothetical protein